VGGITTAAAETRVAPQTGRIFFLGNVVFTPKRTCIEKNEHDDTEKQPSVDQVINTYRLFHTAEVTNHDYHVGTQPIGNYRNNNRQHDKDYPTRKASIRQISVENT